MKSLIVTVAGTATRFNRDTKVETLKCLYYEESPQYCLLYHILQSAAEYDEFIIVGGFLYDNLIKFVNEHFQEFLPKIRLVFNPLFKEYGSGYSLIKGIETVDPNSDEVLFVEGDLYIDRESFRKVFTAKKDVITTNNEAILANKAVVLYVDEHTHVHYLYDTSHSALFIPEAFTAIYNSGQTWKFRDIKRLRSIVDNLTEKQVKGTNLEIIQGYFGAMSMENIDVIKFSHWYNCNTVADYNTVYSIIKD